MNAKVLKLLQKLKPFKVEPPPVRRTDGQFKIVKYIDGVRPKTETTFDTYVGRRKRN